MTDKEKMTARFSHGGLMGGKFNIMIGEKYVGYFYQDASEGIDAEDVLLAMVEAWNRANT